MNTAEHSPQSRNERSKLGNPLWRQIWRGTRQRRLGCGGFLGVILLVVLVGLLYRLGLTMLRLPGSRSMVGWVCLFASLCMLLGAIYLGVRAFLRLGLRNALIASASFYVIAVLIVGLTIPTGLTGGSHWSGSAQRVALWTSDSLQNIWLEFAAIPETVRFNSTGRRPPLRYPGVEWEGGQPPPPIVVNVDSSGQVSVESSEDVSAPPAATQPASEEVNPPAIGISDTVRVVGTDGAALRARVEPSRGAAVTARFPEGTRLIVLDGPRENDGLVWWRVQGDIGEGWCAADFLSREN